MTSHYQSIRAGAWSNLSGSGTAEIMCRAGAAWVTLDAQHGTYDDVSMRQTLLDIGPLPAPVYVRVLENSTALIGRALDAGAAGVIVPMVDSPEQAQKAANACRYPPGGQRSWGPTGTLMGRTAPEPLAANESMMCAVMVETVDALDCIEQIASIEGVDMVFVGPFDLALALGRNVDDLLADDTSDSPLAVIVAACERAGIRSGAFAGTPARADRLAQINFTDLAVMTDTALLAAAAREEMSRWQAVTPQAGSSSGY